MALVKRKRESSPSPSSSSSRQPKYDVFLSFRGEDTRTNFTDHLYVALKRKGIITFRDEEELKKGERISELFKAIEESQFAIIIFSTNYASSTWCLDELAKINKCKDEIGLEILPVFYNVSPSIVRKQTETFEQAFIDHQKRFEDNIEKVETWRDTLKKVADIKGWDLHLQNRLESEIIQDIVKVIMVKLSSKFSSINKNSIGIKSMVAELIPSYLGFGNDIYMMGICGMGGLGKTTVASAIYYEYSHHFESSSFIANVRERSEKGELHKLQQQLLDEILEGSNTTIYSVQAGVKKIESSGLCNKKVLLVLDDVNHKDQLENLVGEHNWFGPGSWIIITTRDELVLKQHRVLKIYKPNGLDDDDALTLFCSKAFNKEQPEKGYTQLSQIFVKYASGLPLALVTLGSFLVRRTVKEWQSAFDSLKKNKGDIHKILKISYDGLEEMWKEIFLDIVCFFRWTIKDKTIEILENCGLNARIGISVLVEKSLLTIDNDKWLTMHDLLQEMGKKIVCQESSGNLGKQSRLWLNEDLFDVLTNNKATGAIQAIVASRCGEDFNLEDFSEGFSKMSNLRSLRIYERGVHLNDQRHLALPNNLRYLQWHYCPFKYLASSHKQRMEFVHLDLYHGKFEYLWEGVMLSKNLKHIDLGHSYNLIRTPDFSGVPNLEELRLPFCDRLVEIHPSIGQLSRLRYLDLQRCYSLTDLPCMSAVMQSLTFLDLRGCTNLESLPRLPSTVRFVDAKGCSSLKWSPKRVKLRFWSQPFSQWLPYYECISGVRFAIFFNFLEGFLRREDVLDGTIIPSCFTERKGTSISIELPSNWYNNKWIGFALWASLSYVNKESDIRASVIALGNIPQNDRVSEHFTTSISNRNSMCLLYLSRADWFAKVGNGECSQIKVRFEIHKSVMGGECWVSLIYKQGVDEFNETNAQCLIKSFGEEACMHKLTAGDDDDDDDDDDDVHIVDDDDDDDDDVHIVHIVDDDDDDDDDDVHIVDDDDDDDDDIHDGDVKKVVDDDFHDYDA